MNEDGEAYVLTKDGETVGALIPMENYESFLETSDVLADGETLRNLETALKEEKVGNLWKRDKSGKWSRLKKKTTAARKSRMVKSIGLSFTAPHVPTHSTNAIRWLSISFFPSGSSREPLRPQTLRDPRFHERIHFPLQTYLLHYPLDSTALSARLIDSRSCAP